MVITIAVIVCALALLLFFLILPGESSAAQRAPFWGVNFAHRGLHTQNRSVPENSLAAFTAAVDAGCGIELDIQLSKDGEVMVFHDPTLSRVCGVEGRLDSYTLEELRAFRLVDSEQGIPTLWEVLYVVKGKVPLLVELKTGPQNTQLCEAAWKILRTYEGDVCVESFDPRIVRWWKRQVPGMLRGQLGARPKALGGGATGFVVGNGLGNFLGRPHFLAYQKGPQPPTIQIASRFAMRVVWTAHPDDDTAKLEDAYDAVIFEFYTPEPRYRDAPGVPASWPEDEEYRF